MRLSNTTFQPDFCQNLTSAKALQNGTIPIWHTKKKKKKTAEMHQLQNKKKNHITKHITPLL